MTDIKNGVVFSLIAAAIIGVISLIVIFRDPIISEERISEIQTYETYASCSYSCIKYTCDGVSIDGSNSSCGLKTTFCWGDRLERRDKYDARITRESGKIELITRNKTVAVLSQCN